jgi:hypothetical protein
MVQKLRFPADSGSVEDVRALFLRRLRDQPAGWQQINHHNERSFGGYAEFPMDRDWRAFNELADEVVWDLIAQGIIMPGSVGGGSNLHSASLPHFRVTSYGRLVLKAGNAIPQDAQGYLDELRASGKECLDSIAQGYVEEASIAAVIPQRHYCWGLLRKPPF